MQFNQSVVAQHELNGVWCFGDAVKIKGWRACVDVARGTRFNAAVYVPNIFPFNVKVINLFSINAQGMIHDTIIWLEEVESINVVNVAPLKKDSQIPSEPTWRLSKAKPSQQNLQPPDDDRMVSHDAIFYVRDATSKLSWISAWNNVVFSAVYFLFLLR